MKIAQIAPLNEAAYLSDALVSLGHEVTHFALKPGVAAHLAMLHEVSGCAEQFDILHFHVDLLHFPLFGHYAPQTVTTLHHRLDLADLAAVYHCWPEYGLVSVSDDQRKPLPGAHWLATVHPGLPAASYQPQYQRHGAYFAFLGRIASEQRPDVAIKLAIEMELPIKLAGTIDPSDRTYFDACIAPLLNDPLVEFLGEVDDADRSRLLGDALALLSPIDQPEPFGIGMIEALACGTPVVAWDAGSVREVIDDGVTGFIVATPQQARIALERCEALDRRHIRAVFQRRFSAHAMAKSYINVYAKLLESACPRTQRAIDPRRNHRARPHVDRNVIHDRGDSYEQRYDARPSETAQRQDQGAVGQAHG